MTVCFIMIYLVGWWIGVGWMQQMCVCVNVDWMGFGRTSIGQMKTALSTYYNRISNFFMTFFPVEINLMNFNRIESKFSYSPKLKTFIIFFRLALEEILRCSQTKSGWAVNWVTLIKPQLDNFPYLHQYCLIIREVSNE